SDHMDGVAELFGRRVRALRRARGMTQDDLGRAAKLDPKHVGSIERGEKTASFDAVEKLARALGVRYHELFLPDRISGEIEQSLADVLNDAGSLDRPAMQAFLRDLLGAVRRLDRKTQG